MNKRTLLPMVSGMVAMFAACSQVPITDRNQVNIIPSGQLLELSATQYSAFMQEHQISDQEQWVEMVQRVGSRLSRAVEEYMRQIGNAERVDDLIWEFNLIESDEKNAFAMPGGKVVVYEGLMNVINGEEAELAAVMGHEIAHVIAEHGNERMSQQLLTQLGGSALGAALGENPGAVQNALMTAYGVGTQVGVLLPFSRTHETEADKLGLIFMAKAGYDPEEAVDVWEKMSAQGEGTSPPQFLSTHPTHESRIAALREFMPEAKKHYQP